MSKVLVDRGALEEAAKWLEVHSSSSGSAEAFSAEALREAIAQTAEAEGAVEVGSDAWMALHLLDRLSVDSSDELRVMQIEGIVKSMGAALSAVTAERDRLDAECGRLLEGKIQDAETIYILKAERDQLRAEVEALRNDAERYRWLREQEAKDGIAVLPVGRWNMPALLCTTPFDSPEMVDSAVDAAMSAKEA